jgi:filamentous hemagglutinin
MWTATWNKTPAQNAFKHFQDHGADFGAINALDYVRKAQDFLWNPPGGTLTKIRTNGDVLRYNPFTNTFGIMDANGTPRTFYKPTAGIRYWNRQ